MIPCVACHFGIVGLLFAIYDGHSITNRCWITFASNSAASVQSVLLYVYQILVSICRVIWCDVARVEHSHAVSFGVTHDYLNVRPILVVWYISHVIWCNTCLQELNNPILYLDVMRWCWQQDFRARPSASQLEDILTNPSIPYLVDAISLHNSNTVTCACVCTLPMEILPPTAEMDSNEGSSVFPSPPSAHSSYTAQGDLQEELWLATYNQETGSEIVVINFKGKAAKVHRLI